MLLAPAADVTLSNERALAFLDAQFASLDVPSGSLNDTATELLRQHEELQREVFNSDTPPVALTVWLTLITAS